MTHDVSPRQRALLLRGISLVRSELGAAREACPLVSIESEQRELDELAAALRAPGSHHWSWHIPQGGVDDDAVHRVR